MWLICGATLGRGKNRLLVRGITGAEWAFCPSIRSTKRDRVSISHCQGCRHFIRFEQAYIPQKRASKETASFKAMTFRNSFNAARKIRRPRPTQSFASPHLMPTLTAERQAPIDVFEEGNYLVVLAELRGIDEKDVKIETDEDFVTITAESTVRRYYKTIRLPTRVNKDTAEFTCRNNILQLKLKKLRKKAKPRQD